MWKKLEMTYFGQQEQLCIDQLGFYIFHNRNSISFLYITPDIIRS